MKRTPLRNRIHLGPKIGNQNMNAHLNGLINDPDRAGRLDKAMPWVAPQSKLFVQSLIDYHQSMGGWTPKQSIYVDRMLDAARDNYRRDKANNGRASTVSKDPLHREPPAEPMVSNEAMTALNRMFDAAREAGLKRRRITLAAINIVPAREGTGYAMFDNGVTGSEAFLGSIRANGTLSLKRNHEFRAQKIADAISAAGENPGKVGREIGACIFCARELTDERSLVKGYGPICAVKWNLPWGDK